MCLTVDELEQKAREMRKLCMELSYRAGCEGAHVGPALSIMDIMTALYYDVMNLRREEPDWGDRDRFILSKGHGVLGLYAPLILKGFISREEAESFNGTNTRLAGHPSGIGVGGIEHPAGSLGHGLSVACGMALSGAMDGRPYKVYTLIGDGESEEGSIWEAAMFASRYGLGNLTAVIDVNGFQYGGVTGKMMDPEHMADKWRAFGWNARIVDGHDMAQLREALDKDKLAKDKPTCIVARTIKGRGFSKAVNNNDWHHVKISREDMNLALEELEQEGKHE